MLQKTSPTALTLLAAADYIRKYGWCQGSMNDPEGRVCIRGAIAMVVLGRTEQYGQDESNRIDEILSIVSVPIIEGGFYSSPQINWNDRDGRTKEEVIAALEAAAASI